MNFEPYGTVRKWSVMGANGTTDESSNGSPWTQAKSTQMRRSRSIDGRNDGTTTTRTRGGVSKKLIFVQPLAPSSQKTPSMGPWSGRDRQSGARKENKEGGGGEFERETTEGAKAQIK